MSRRERPPTPTPTPPATRWTPRVRAFASLLIALHVLAVFAGPFGQGPSSLLGSGLRGLLRPYLECCYLGHGYRFFNEPGPSHMIRYELEFADGRKETGQFPDREVHRPRLLYHRHFMLAEHLNTMWLNAPPQRPPGMQPGSAMEQDWLLARKRVEAYLDSYAQHLMQVHDAQRVTLIGLERVLPSLHDVAVKGHRIDHPQYMFQPIPIGTFNRKQR